ncbi:hypothetical protein [Paraburkholderia phosphatilytica]|uniref:hypothetical protein n=1 Tax=Paraburkholderia phosphatilytica TaxID=2282883 RepID=UPI000E5138E3|nr:hypothetical protein [Paraburkholderia phosphatilytica]
MDMRVLQAVVHPMPEVAAFVANLKAAFGEAEIDEAIRRGKAGEPGFFYAAENGRSVGTASPPSAAGWPAGDGVRNRAYCHGCDGSCVGREVTCQR